MATNKTDKRTTPLYVESVDNTSANSKMIVMHPKSFDDIQALMANRSSSTWTRSTKNRRNACSTSCRARRLPWVAVCNASRIPCFW